MYVIKSNQYLSPWNVYESRDVAEHECELLNMEHPDQYQVMSMSDFNLWLRHKLLTDAVQISAQVWQHALEIMPPVEWFQHRVPETFFMSEEIIDGYAEQFGRMGDVYLKKVVKTNDPDTFICERDFEQLQPLQSDTPLTEEQKTA